MDTAHRGSALTFAGAAAGLSTARPRTADFPEKLLRIIMPYLCRHPGKRHGAIQFVAGGRAAAQCQFEAVVLKPWAKVTNRNPYFWLGASFVARSCPPHTTWPGRTLD